MRIRGMEEEEEEEGLFPAKCVVVRFSSRFLLRPWLCEGRLLHVGGGGDGGGGGGVT